MLGIRFAYLQTFLFAALNIPQSLVYNTRWSMQQRDREEERESERELKEILTVTKIYELFLVRFLPRRTTENIVQTQFHECELQ